MLVEDDPLLSEMLGELLTDELGCQVLVCNSAEQALPLLDGGADPALIILDLVLHGSGMDGTTLLRAIKEQPRFRGLPVVVCTATMLSDEQWAGLLRAGAAAVLSKPFDLVQLLTVARDLGATEPRRPPPVRPASCR